MGLGLAMAGQGFGRAWGAGFLVSAAVESLQWRFLPERYASIADITANTSGAAIGYLCFALAPVLLRPSRKTALVLVVTAIGGWTLACMLTGWALRPDLPHTSTWWGQWAHHFAGTVPLRGRILAVSVNDYPVPDDSLQNTPAFRAEIAAHVARFEVRASGLMKVDGRAQVVALTDGEGDMIVAIEQEGCVLRLVARRQADRVGFGVPALNLPASCAGSVDTVEIVATSAPQYMSISQRSANGERTARMTLRPTLGWWLLIPQPRSVNCPALSTLLWIGLLLSPMAYWASSLHVSSLAGLIVLATFALGTVALSAATFRLHSADLVDAVGVVGALLTGWTLGRLTGEKWGKG